MTGMGHDGAAGLLKLRGLNWRTIAQDEGSSVVWGMPKAAAEVGEAEEILPLSHIANAITRLVPNQACSFPGISNLEATPAEKS